MYSKFKRVLDSILAVCILIVALPVMLMVAIAIKSEDPKGPVIFKQTRVGKDKKPFKIYKFRSMWTKTPDVPTHLLKDPNQFITKTGKFLRKTSLDEVPQVVNILKGDMAFVGPRPSLFSQQDLIAERDKLNVHSVRPGLTGLAQISGRDELPIPVKAAYDGEYVEKISFKMDLQLFFRTFVSVLKSDGVVEGGTGKMSVEKTVEHVEVEEKVGA
ncbi:MAG: sugar transferase [Cellulosilyticaceae bacterium]